MGYFRAADDYSKKLENFYKQSTVRTRMIKNTGVLCLCHTILRYSFTSNWKKGTLVESISSTFYERVFHTKFLHQKIQSRNITRESCTIRFRTKNTCLKCWWNWHLEITIFWSLINKMVRVLIMIIVLYFQCARFSWPTHVRFDLLWCAIKKWITGNIECEDLQKFNTFNIQSVSRI